MAAWGTKPQSGNRSKGRNMVFRVLTRGLLAAALLIVAAPSGRAQSVADFYKGKTIDLYIGYSVGGAYDLYARQLARHMGKHIPGNPNVVPKNMEGAGKLAAGELALQRRPEGRHGLRHHRPRHRLRSAARQQGGEVRRHQIHLDRQRQQRSQHLRRLEHQRHHQVRGPADQGTDRRRHQHLGGHRPVPEDHQRRARHQDEDRHRLSRRQRGRSRHGARRGAGPLRLVVVEREIDPPEMARREEVHHPGPARARQASRPAGRAAHRRPRQDRRAATNPAADLRAPGDGPPVPRAAEHSARPRRGAARRLHGDDEGQGFPCRHREGPRWKSRRFRATGCRRW